MFRRHLRLRHILAPATTLFVQAAILISSGTAAAVVVDRAQVNLAWQAPECSDVAGYNVLRATQPGGPYTKLNGALLTSVSFTDDSVEDMATYFYVVTSRDFAGNESAPGTEFESEQVDIDLAADPDGDCDTDGLPNGWETEHGLDPRDPDDATADADNDGLTNVDEYQLGTDPTVADTDGDGTSDADDLFPTDGAETADADGDGIGDNADTDDDNDGLLDVLEDGNGNGRVDVAETDPFNSDTDGDGTSDGDEDANLNGCVEAGETDPRLSDTDGDGISDSVEVDMGTDPLLFDTDRDGIADGLDEAPLDGMVTGDTDGDGVVDALDDAPADPTVYILDNDEYEQNDDPQNIPMSSRFSAGDFVIEARIVETDIDHYLIDTTDVASASTPLVIEVWAGAGDRIDVHLLRSDTLETVDSAFFVRERRLDLQLAGTATAIVPGAVVTLPADLVAAGIAALVRIESSFAGDDVNNRFGGTQSYSLRVSMPTGTGFEADTDSDGLTDGEEWVLRTDVTLEDTDFDGLADGDETVLGTEPTVADTDGDGAIDGEDASPLGFGENHAPSAVISCDLGDCALVAVTAGTPIALRATDSYDSDNDALSFTWNFGDGTTGFGSYVDHVFSEPGTYSVTLTADDGRGGTHTVALTVQVDPQPATDTVNILWAYNIFGRLRIAAESSASPDAELTMTITDTGKSWKLVYSTKRDTYRKTVRQHKVSGSVVRVTSSLGGYDEVVIW